MAREICYGTSYTDVAYTIRGSEICCGTSYTDVAYTIRGSEICRGTSYTDVAYTIRGSEICHGTSYTDVAYTIRGSEICHGTSYTDVAYTVRFNSGGGSGNSLTSDSKPVSYFPTSYGPWTPKKTICLLITLALQLALIGALLLGKIDYAINESFSSYIIVNVIMFANALISGILCKIAWYRVGSILSTVVNAILGIYIFVVAISSMEGFVIILALLFFGFVEYWVVRGGYIVSSFFCKVHH